MRFRTKLFIASVLVVLSLWAGTLWPIGRIIASNFEDMTDADFAGTRQNLQSLQAEHVGRMRQVGKMVMQIPELRALIAEHNFEVSVANTDSLRERLDSLTRVMDVQFVCVFDGHGDLIAQNSASPWGSLPELRDYISQSAQAQPLVRKLFAPTRGPDAGAGASDQGEYGLWFFNGRLYQVVGLPLVFASPDDASATPDGALIMAAPITNVSAGALGTNHSSEISFIAEGKIAATSLAKPLQDDLFRRYSTGQWPTYKPFGLTLGGQTFRSFAQPLVDPCSNTILGTMIFQSSEAGEEALLRNISRSLLGIMSIGLLAAALASFILSGAITKPVQTLLFAVKKVAGGDLNSTISVARHDELGELASAFNDMVTQLRTRGELQRKVDESNAANQAKSRFLANMSHEIRTPLHGVIGMANLLLASELNDRQRHHARLIKTSTEVLTTLISDILDFSKIEAGRLELESVEFPLSSIVEDVVEILSQKAFANGVEIACRVAGDIPRALRGDSNRLRQILMNLVGNAVKFTDRGQVIVTVEREKIAGKNQKMSLRFTVSDSGVGIPPDRIDRLFKSFSQIDASTTRRFGGTGLGLAISKQLAELMGGAIGVESRVGQGSTFWFTAQFDVSDAPRELPAEGLAGLRVLVAQHNHEIRQTIQDQLRDAGIDAQGASTANECRHLLGASENVRPFDVMLIDQQFPDLDLPGLTSSARQMGTKLPAFLLLATLQNDFTPQAFRAEGFSGCIAKPVRRDALLQAIARAAGVDVRLESASDALNDDQIRPIDSARRFRVLVAEDNEINQLVAAEFLEKLGCQIHVVADGSRAVAAQLQNPFDLILMDCQMPVMDGFAATQAIRNHEQTVSAAGQNVHRVPIVALTANASGADRQRCLDAGMDAYCEKPFRTRELIATIQSFLSDKSGGNSPDNSATATAAGPPQPAVLDLDGFLRQCSGNPSLALSILDKFEAQTRSVVGQLEQSLADQDAEQIARLSHALKGTAGILAADALRAALARLEEIGRAKTLDPAQAGIDQLRQEIDRCLACLPETRRQLQKNRPA